MDVCVFRGLGEFGILACSRYVVFTSLFSPCFCLLSGCYFLYFFLLHLYEADMTTMNGAVYFVGNELIVFHTTLLHTADVLSEYLYSH